jgi:hypothetical protein
MNVQVTPETVMIRPLLLKPQRMNGLSERLLVSHFENNYGGALRRLNAIRARLGQVWPRCQPQSTGRQRHWHQRCCR